MTVLIYIASCLDTSGYKNTHALAEIPLCKLACAVKCHTVDKICSLLGVSILDFCGPLLSTARVYLAIAIERSPWEYLTSGSLVNLPIKITLFIRSHFLFNSA